jgi:hypothetical protein
MNTGCDFRLDIARGRRIETKIAGLQIVVLWFLAGCATITQTQRHWGPWETDEWTQSGQRPVSTAKISTVPAGAEVVLDNGSQGFTPTALSLSYTQETRTRQRHLYETITRTPELGAWKGSPRVLTSEVNRESQTESRALPKEHRIVLKKQGYFPKSITIIVPRDEEETIQMHLKEREILWIYPVSIAPALEQKTGPFRWLRDNVFFRQGVKEDAYQKMAAQVTERVRASFSETGQFMDVFARPAQGAGDGACLAVDIIPAQKEMLLRGELRSSRILGSRCITREQTIAVRGIEKELGSACAGFAGALVRPYLEAANESSN